MARRESSPPPGPPTCAAWLASYGDMITLILTFFILLFSFSTVDAQKWQELVKVFSGEIENLDKADELSTDGIPNVPEASSPGSSDYPVDVDFNEEWKGLYDSLTQFVKQPGAGELAPGKGPGEGPSVVDVEYTDATISILLPDSLLFDSGRAELKSGSLEIIENLVLQQIVPRLDLMKNIVIEGHTDTVPLRGGGRYADNRELSYWRATSVCVAIEKMSEKIPPQFLQAKACGEFFPIYEQGNAFPGLLSDPGYYPWVLSQNETAEQKQRNRRCVIVLERDVALEIVDPTAR